MDCACSLCLQRSSAISEQHFRRAATDVRAAMATVEDASDVLALLLEGGHSTIAGRLAGAFRNAGHARIADEIVETMETAGYTVRETDPFEDRPGIVLSTRDASPYVNRIRLMWDAMRQPVLDVFPAAPGLPETPSAYLKAVDDVYVNDAYHSLSIEGYKVSPELIERVRSGAWNPDGNAQDRENRNAMAARGYFDAFRAVKGSLAKVLSGADAGAVARDDHARLVPATLRPERSRRHHHRRRSGRLQKRPGLTSGAPCMCRRRAMRCAIACPRSSIFWRRKREPSVRVVLGHFVFVYIHPYMDGNGRMGRFLMNVMLASGGYPWTIVPLERRDDYVAALESASVRQDIRPFAAFVAGLVEGSLQGQPAPAVPVTRARA